MTRRCVLLLCAIAVCGCRRQAEPGSSKLEAAPALVVATVKPERKNLRRIIEQPATIEAFEETPLVARIPGYVDEVRGDIGMTFRGPHVDAQSKAIHPGELLAKLSVPELVQEH